MDQLGYASSAFPDKCQWSNFQANTVVKSAWHFPQVLLKKIDTEDLKREKGRLNLICLQLNILKIMNGENWC